MRGASGAVTKHRHHGGGGGRREQGPEGRSHRLPPRLVQDSRALLAQVQGGPREQARGHRAVRRGGGLVLERERDAAADRVLQGCGPHRGAFKPNLTSTTPTRDHRGPPPTDRPLFYFFIAPIRKRHKLFWTVLEDESCQSLIRHSLTVPPYPPRPRTDDEPAG